MATAASDDSKLVLLGAVGNTFCYGLDFLYFIRRLTDDRKKESVKMAETIRYETDGVDKGCGLSGFHGEGTGNSHVPMRVCVVSYL